MRKGEDKKPMSLGSKVVEITIVEVMGEVVEQVGTTIDEEMKQLDDDKKMVVDLDSSIHSDDAVDVMSLPFTTPLNGSGMYVNKVENSDTRNAQKVMKTVVAAVQT